MTFKIKIYIFAITTRIYRQKSDRRCTSESSDLELIMRERTTDYFAEQ